MSGVFVQLDVSRLQGQAARASVLAGCVEAVACPGGTPSAEAIGHAALAAAIGHLRSASRERVGAVSDRLSQVGVSLGEQADAAALADALHPFGVGVA